MTGMYYIVVSRRSPECLSQVGLHCLLCRRVVEHDELLVDGVHLLDEVQHLPVVGEFEVREAVVQKLTRGTTVLEAVVGEALPQRKRVALLVARYQVMKMRRKQLNELGIYQ